MARIDFFCEKCNKSKIILFKPGNPPEPPICECGQIMTRNWNKVGTGSIVTDEMVSAAQMMINSTTISGKDRKVF